MWGKKANNIKQEWAQCQKKEKYKAADICVHDVREKKGIYGVNIL